MSVRAVATLAHENRLHQALFQPQNQPATYGISVFVSIYNDDPSIALQTQIEFSGNPGLISVSYLLNPKKADKFIRKTIADVVFAGLRNPDTAGWVIDPDDIYFPMTN